MAKTFLLKPEDVIQHLRNSYKKQKKQWLTGNTEWPLKLSLGLPTEKQAFDYLMKYNMAKSLVKLEWRGRDLSG